jgi:drug/metabolite transporter (DMT)-like permease
VHEARPPRPDPLGLAAAGATALAWGLVGPLVRLLPGLTPLELVAGRLGVALAAALPALALPAARREAARALRSRPAWALALLLTAYYLLAVAAFRAAPVADVALLLATAPLWALLLRRVRGGAPAAPGDGAGALVALAGVAVTLVPSVRGVAGGGASAGAARLGGDVLALLAAATSAGYALVFADARARAQAVAGRRPGDAAAAPHAPPSAFGVALLTFAVGTGALALRAAAYGQPLLRAGRLDARGWALLAVLGVASTLVPTLAFAEAARRLPPVLTSAAQLLVPVVAAAAAAAALGEVPSPWLVPGGALVAGGLWRLVRGAAPAAPARPPSAAPPRPSGPPDPSAA